MSSLLTEAAEAQRTGDWGRAYSVYRQAAAAYPLARPRLRPQLAESALALAARLSGRGDFERALEVLRNAYDPALPVGLKQRLNERYLDAFIKQCVQRISRTTQKTRRISVAPARIETEGGGFPFEADGFAVRLCRSLNKEGYRAQVRFLSADSYDAVFSGRWSSLAYLEQGDDSPLLCALRVDRDLTLFLYDPKRKRTDVVVVAPALGGRLSAGTLWDDVIGADRSRPGFKVRVWTDRSSYRIGDSLKLYIRSDRECFVTVVILNSDGSTTAFLPVLERRSNFVLPQKVYMVPDSEGRPFELVIEGPPGREYVKVIATAGPVELGITDRSLDVRTLVSILAERLSELDPGRWATAGWSFTVRP